MYLYHVYLYYFSLVYIFQNGGNLNSQINFIDGDVPGHLDVARMLVPREHSIARRKIIYGNLPKNSVYHTIFVIIDTVRIRHQQHFLRLLNKFSLFVSNY